MKIIPILKIREEIISALYNCGIDPFANYKDLTSYDSLQHFACEMREAITNAYKMNVGIYLPQNDEYVDARTYWPINIKKEMLSGHPNILYYKMTYKRDKKNIYYKLTNIDFGKTKT
jgi:hypothetical protein